MNESEPIKKEKISSKPSVGGSANFWCEALSLKNQQELYYILIAAKNEWNNRAQNRELNPSMKKAYLHFENFD